MPSIQLWSNLLLPVPPQFLYQAPPGAQQLTRPDFLNVLHFGHILFVEATPIVLRDVIIGVGAIFHRASHRWGDDPHTVDEIDPGEPSKISILLAFELAQAAPQSC